MGWTALVPLKAPNAAKSRLAPHLAPAERRALVRGMADHVLALAAAHPLVSRLVLLSAGRPRLAAAHWLRDQGRGLNAELDCAAAALGETDLLVIHADLPLLGPADISRLLEQAAIHGAAIAPDRHGSGTNAIATRAPLRIGYAFGAESLRRHRAALGPLGVSVDTLGLRLDIDRIDDLELAIGHGFIPRCAASARAGNLREARFRP